MLWALSNAITPSTPFEWFGIVFAVVILGGIGNVAGTLLAGVLIGDVVERRLGRVVAGGGAARPVLGDHRSPCCSARKALLAGW